MLLRLCLLGLLGVAIAAVAMAAAIASPEPDPTKTLGLIVAIGAWLITFISLLATVYGHYNTRRNFQQKEYPSLQLNREALKNGEYRLANYGSSTANQLSCWLELSRRGIVAPHLKCQAVDYEKLDSKDEILLDVSQKNYMQTLVRLGLARELPNPYQDNMYVIVEPFWYKVAGATMDGIVHAICRFGDRLFADVTHRRLAVLGAMITGLALWGDEWLNSDDDVTVEPDESPKDRRHRLLMKAFRDECLCKIRHLPDLTSKSNELEAMARSEVSRYRNRWHMRLLRRYLIWRYGYRPVITLDAALVVSWKVPLALAPEYGLQRWQHSIELLCDKTVTSEYSEGGGMWGAWKNFLTPDEVPRWSVVGPSWADMPKVSVRFGLDSGPTYSRHRPRLR